MEKTLDQRIRLTSAMNSGGITSGIIYSLTCRLQVLGVLATFFQSKFGSRTHTQLLCLCSFFLCIYFIGFVYRTPCEIRTP